MSDAITGIDADLGRVNAAAAQLAAALAQENSSSTSQPGEVQRGHAAVQAAEAYLAQAEAALHADQAAQTVQPSQTAQTTQVDQAAPAEQHAVTDPGGIVV